jgi:mRNA-degrading endonuclease RelE of RelBE toxin-antitoxin system
VKYKVTLIPPAERTYQNIHRLSAGDSGNVQANIVQLLDALLDDVLPSSPFSGTKLPGSLSGTYLISRQTIQLIYEIHPKTFTVIILLIIDAPAREEYARRADLICTQMLLSGKVQLLPSGIVRRAAAN